MTAVPYPVITFPKDPQAVLDYSTDWSSWLADGETITSHTVEAAAGITVNSDAADDDTVTCWLSGGTVETDYLVTHRITTSEGRTDDRTIRIRVDQR